MNSHTTRWDASSARYTTTHAAMSEYVTTGTADGGDRPPRTVRGTALRTPRLPSLTHSTHWCPTAASRMQSGQM